MSNLSALPLDHLVLAVPHVDEYVSLFAQYTGVTPVFGGVHEGRGTKNYLVRLDMGGPNPAYLELLGLDPDQANVAPDDTMFRLGHLGDDVRPHIRTWALHPGGLDELTATARGRGVDFGSVESWSRLAPDGTLLEWQVAIRPDVPLDGLQPFLIDWGASPHPSRGPDLGTVALVELSVEHPDPQSVRDVFDAIGVAGRVPVSRGLVPRIVAVLDTPNGRVEIP